MNSDLPEMSSAIRGAVSLSVCRTLIRGKTAFMQALSREAEGGEFPGMMSQVEAEKEFAYQRALLVRSGYRLIEAEPGRIITEDWRPPSGLRSLVTLSRAWRLRRGEGAVWEVVYLGDGPVEKVRLPDGVSHRTSPLVSEFYGFDVGALGKLLEGLAALENNANRH